MKLEYTVISLIEKQGIFNDNNVKYTNFEQALFQ